LTFRFLPAGDLPMKNGVRAVRVRLFARARDVVGADALLVEVPDGATVADLRRRLAEERPALRGLLEHSALAVNDDFADDRLTLPLEAEVALLPPVSGGERTDSWCD
jgi:molybdopterin converting factor subunit 1